MKVMGGDTVFEGDYMLGLVTNTLSVGGFKNLLPRENIALDDGEYGGEEQDVEILNMEKQLAIVCEK